MNRESDLLRAVHFFETLSVDTVQQLNLMYTDDAFFKNPFNEAHGRPAICRVFKHMFMQVTAPRLMVLTHAVQGDDAFLIWHFMFRMKLLSSAEQCIQGASHLRFSKDGRIDYHCDYWDTAEELYEKVPLLGSLMRLLKRMASS